jgi:hypothetical protein
MVDEFHQPLASGFVCRLDENRPDRMDTERLLVPLLLLDEVGIPAELPQHVGDHHRAAISLVEEVSELSILRAVLKTQGKESVRLNRHSLGRVNLLPKELACLPCGPDLGHIRLVAGDLPTLTPRLKRYDTARFPARHFDHEMHPRDHQAVVQKPELHVLATNGRACIVLLAVAANFFEYLRMDLKPAPLGQEVERLAAIQVVVKLAVRPEAREGPASHEATLPKPPQAPVRDILIVTHKAYNLRCRTEPVPQNNVEDVEVAVGDLSAAPGFRPDEF